MTDLPALSLGVLAELLDLFVAAKQAPSAQALADLAASAGLAPDDIKASYQRAYATAGNEGDPWTPRPPIIGEDY